MLSPEKQLEVVKMVNFANEFLKISHGLKAESDREDQLPVDIVEYLANEHLDKLMKEDELEPEMLLWGLVNIVEIVLKFAEVDPDELTEMISLFVKTKREELNG